MGLLGVLKIVKNSNIILLMHWCLGQNKVIKSEFFVLKTIISISNNPDVESLSHDDFKFRHLILDRLKRPFLGPPTRLPRCLSAFKRLRQYLRDLIRPMLEMIEKSNNSDVGHPVLQKKGPSTVVQKLSQQINMFWRDEYPFRVLVASKSIWL